MKAVIFKKYGLPDVLQKVDIPKPVPGDQDLLIKVAATTVNRTDCAILTAKPFIMRLVMGFFGPRKQVPGTDFSGVVEGKGKEVTGFNIGDKVFGFDDSGVQSKAEYLVFPSRKAVIQMAAHQSFEEAAASAEGAHYAYNMIRRLKIKRGDRVLVIGASGAIGSAAVQISKYFGAEIVAVCNAKNLDLARSFGVEEVIDYEVTDYTKGEPRFQFVFDTVGKSSFGKCKSVMLPGAVYISSELGKNGQNLFYSIFPFLGGKHRVKFPVPLDPKGSLLFIRKMIEEGKFRPVIDRSYSLDEIKTAYEYVMTGQKTGNVLIVMDGKE